MREVGIKFAKLFIPHIEYQEKKIYEKQNEGTSEEGRRVSFLK